MKMILASASPRRQQLLGMITPDFKVITSQVDERAITADTPALLAQKLARAKCLAVAQSHPGRVVLGCDTVVEKDGQVLGKPADAADAVRMLQMLAGAEHQVHTGVCIAKDGEMDNFVVTSTVEFYPLAEAEIQAYVATGEPFDKAGGYGIQGGAALFCRGIRGCYYNIMGLPVSRVARALRKFL